MQRRDLLRLDRLHQIAAVTMSTGQCHHQPCAGDQWPEELPHRDIEAERRLLQHGIGAVELIDLLHPEQPIADGALSVDDTFGLTSGAGGVNQVSEIVSGNRRAWILLAEVSKCVPVRVEADESGIKSREGGGDMLLAKDQRESGIIEHEGEALLWVMRVERDVASTGFKNGKQSDDHLKATLHGDTD